MVKAFRETGGGEVRRCGVGERRGGERGGNLEGYYGCECGLENVEVGGDGRDGHDGVLERVGFKLAQVWPVLNFFFD